MYESNKLRPLSPWEYFGYSVLFSLPLIGLVFLIIFSFSGKNVNRRNFARSYFCGIALVIILAAAVIILRKTVPQFVTFLKFISQKIKFFEKNTLHL